MKKGFTLIELLVVISIIGILAALSLVSFTGAQKQTRDTQRRSDLGQYRNALENYASANSGLYPIHNLANVNLVDICGAGKDLTTSFIASCPDDTTTTQNYTYRSSADGTQYVLTADLETAGYFYICSTGKSGAQDAAPAVGDCE